LVCVGYHHDGSPKRLRAKVITDVGRLDLQDYQADFDNVIMRVDERIIAVDRHFTSTFSSYYMRWRVTVAGDRQDFHNIII
jgi:hypothetical protein